MDRSTARGERDARDQDSAAMTRRDTLRLGALAGLMGVGGLGGVMGGVLGGCQAGGRAGAATGEGARAGRAGGSERLIRIAHLTDTHIQPERGAFDGVAACLRHVQSRRGSERADVIVTGGDLIMDGFAAEHDRTRAQWELWQRVLRDECSLPVYHTLGNHDIWGWNKGKSRTTGAESGWGKAWACEMVGRETPYASFDVGGVRLVILDSTQVDPDNADGYIAYCDEAQMDWLKRTLRETPTSTPIVVVSHISIVSATALAYRKPEMQRGDHRINRGVLHADGAILTDLFRTHRNVRACLSGHMHQVERIDIEGVTYVCSGAVSGGWWGGPNGTTESGYALIDIYRDGRVGFEYVPFGWAYRA